MSRAGVHGAACGALRASGTASATAASTSTSASASPAAWAAAVSVAGAASASASLAPVASAATIAIGARGGRCGHVCQVSARVALGHDFALIDPALDADSSERRARLVEAVVDVGAHRVQRHAAVGIGFGAGHLGAAEATGDLDLDALRTGAHCACQRTLHRAAEGDAVLQLLGDRLGDELGVELGTLDLEDVDLDLLARHPVEVLAQ